MLLQIKVGMNSNEKVNFIFCVHCNLQLKIVFIIAFICNMG